jgi:acyl-coenzyme A synthetase/AMP-(fatty) acid ligase
MYAGWLGVGPGDVMLHAGAFNWTYTLGVGLTDPWANGATAVVYNGPKDPTIWGRLINACHATMFAAVPGVYRQLLERGGLDGVDLGVLRHGLTAGEALTAELYAAWQDVTGRPLYEALGMSEISTFVSSGPTVPTRVGSPGKPQAGRCVAVVPAKPQDGDEPVPAGTTGLLAVHRSDPGLMLGYWNRPDEDLRVRRGEWFVGGDLAHIDPDGYVIHHGRADDVMNAMGYRVSPQEVEGVLARHPSVADVGVAELPVRRGVSVVAAFVVPREGWVDGSALLAYAAEHLAGFKVPRKVVVVPELPRTPNGKVLRRELVAAYGAQADGLR